MNRLRGARWEPLECGLPINQSRYYQVGQPAIGLISWCPAPVKEVAPGWPKGRAAGAHGASISGHRAAHAGGTVHAPSGAPTRYRRTPSRSSGHLTRVDSYAASCAKRTSRTGRDPARGGRPGPHGDKAHTSRPPPHRAGVLPVRWVAWRLRWSAAHEIKGAPETRCGACGGFRVGTTYARTGLVGGG